MEEEKKRTRQMYRILCLPVCLRRQLVSEEVRQRSGNDAYVLQSSPRALSEAQGLLGGHAAGRVDQADQSGPIHHGKVRRHSRDREQKEEGHDCRARETRLRFRSRGRLETVAESRGGLGKSTFRIAPAAFYCSIEI